MWKTGPMKPIHQVRWAAQTDELRRRHPDSAAGWALAAHPVEQAASGFACAAVLCAPVFTLLGLEQPHYWRTYALLSA